MKLKITKNNNEELQESIKKVMNIACVVFRLGTLPSEKELSVPELGTFWKENKEENKFELIPLINNHKAFIREKRTDFIVVEFYSRYDTTKQVEALSNLLVATFDNVSFAN